MNRISQILVWIILIIFIVLGTLALVFVATNPINSIYSISARTEALDFTTLDDNLGRYVVYGASIFPDTNKAVAHFDGSIQIYDSTKVTIVRQGSGFINITLSHLKNGIPASFYDIFGNKVDSIYDTSFEIIIDSLKTKMEKGLHHHFFIDGHTNIGRNIDHLNIFESPSIIQNGEVVMLGSSIISGEYYEAGTRKLSLGDRIVFNYDSKSPNVLDKSRGVGFVRIDDLLGMNLAYRQKAHNAIIFKPGPKSSSSGYSVTVSLFDRFKNDKLLKVLSILLGFFVSLLTIPTFFYDTYFYMKSKKVKKEYSTNLPKPVIPNNSIATEKLHVKGKRPKKKKKNKKK